ncbi:unnamed protein product [Coccothraustes coccothraustes]
MAAPPPGAAYPGRRRPALRARLLAGCPTARHPIGYGARRSPAQRPFQARVRRHVNKPPPAAAAAAPRPPSRARRSGHPPGRPRPRRAAHTAQGAASRGGRSPPGDPRHGCPGEAPSRSRGSQRTAVPPLRHYINAAPERGRSRPALPRTRRAVTPLRPLCSAAFAAEPPVGHQHTRAQRPRTATGHPRPSRAFKQLANGGGDHEPERQGCGSCRTLLSPPGQPLRPHARQDGAFLSPALAARLAFLVKARAAPAGRRLEGTTPTTPRSARAPSLQPLLTTPGPQSPAPGPDTPRAPLLSRGPGSHTPPAGERSGAEGPLAPSPSRCPRQPGRHLRPALPPSLQPPARRHRLLPQDHPGPPTPGALGVAQPPGAPRSPRAPDSRRSAGAAARPGPSMRPRVCLFMSLPDGFPEIA